MARAIGRALKDSHHPPYAAALIEIGTLLNPDLPCNHSSARQTDTSAAGRSRRYNGAFCCALK